MKPLFSVIGHHLRGRKQRRGALWRVHPSDSLGVSLPAGIRLDTGAAEAAGVTGGRAPEDRELCREAAPHPGLAPRLSLNIELPTLGGTPKGQAEGASCQQAGA